MDKFDEMVDEARRRDYRVPYLKDEEGRLTKAFGAVTTLHVFPLDQKRRLRYRGRFDDSRDPENIETKD